MKGQVLVREGAIRERAADMLIKQRLFGPFPDGVEPYSGVKTISSKRSSGISTSLGSLVRSRKIQA